MPKGGSVGDCMGAMEGGVSGAISGEHITGMSMVLSQSCCCWPLTNVQTHSAEAMFELATTANKAIKRSGRRIKRLREASIFNDHIDLNPVSLFKGFGNG